MGYYLDIHASDGPFSQVTPERMREVLMEAGAVEVEEGTLMLGAGAGCVITEGDKQRRRENERDEARIEQLLKSIELPAPRKHQPCTAEVLASFRFSWAVDVNEFVDTIRQLLQFCRRHGFRLYDCQMERYVDEKTVQLVVTALTQRKA